MSPSALAVFLLAWCAGAAAQVPAPSVGLLYNTKESHSLTYRCEQKESEVLECEFSQVMVRRKSTEKELEVRLKQGRDEFSELRKDFKKNLGKQCADIQSLIDIVEGRKKPPKQPARPLTATEKADVLQMAKFMQTLCKSPTEENFLALIQFGHAKDMRTCTVAANTYKQSFRPVQDAVSSTPAWVVAQERPQGPCGLVNLSRFEADKEAGLSYLFWKYTARRAVTNPSGVVLGQSCKGFDEDEYLYDWRSKDHALGCDYIEFSVL